MVYSDAFISPYAADEAEPTAEQFAQMGPALRPFVLARMVPAYVAEAPGVPAYRRPGGPIMPLVTMETPKEPGSGLVTQYDDLLRYYHAVGINDYDWQRFGPEMQTASWQYVSFDPPEKQEKAKGDRNRTITYPKGMENWFAADFDSTTAGWSVGKAPFGQKDGKLEALSDRCKDPQCGCSIIPATLWDKEVLLMRQTFEVPPLEDDHRYRIILGGSVHPFSGEGYSIYINGKLFSEAKGGAYKSGAGPRGAYITSEFLSEFTKGKVNIAVKGFLRYTGHVNQEAPSKGHISVWMEAAKMPKEVLALAEKQGQR
jgi:hypothetical protein